MDKKEIALLRNLDMIVWAVKDQPSIQEAISRAEAELSQNPSKLGATVQIPLSVFGKGIPASIKSCRVFALRENAAFKTERHPNSHQRVLSIKGIGEIRVLEEGNQWTARLRSDPDAPFEERWSTVRENTWHQPVAGPEGWVTLTFHTAPEGESLDEYRD